MKITPFIFLIVLCIGLFMSGFFYFKLQGKKAELERLEKGPGGITELINERDADKAYVMNIDLYEKQLLDTKKERDRLKKSIH